MYEKPSKCFFGIKDVEYLGHIVSHEGVKVDPKKIHDGLDDSQNLEKYSSILRFDRVLPQVCSKLWKNSNSSNIVTKEICIFLHSKGKSSLSTTQRGHV